MSPKLVDILVAVAVLGWFVVGSTIAWSNIGRSADGQAVVAKGDPDQYPGVTTFQRRDTMLSGHGGAPLWSSMLRPVGSQPDLKIDLDQAFADATILQRRDIMPARGVRPAIAWSGSVRAVDGEGGSPSDLAKVDFDQVFADAMTMQRRENTPANREKLREAGWKRINGSH
ncbi:MAG TPA: hypothetical protein VK281_18000 [Xanthobacteraceae bacterium]|nr:hypothetical protein [Xanthobacteraceae bacterium]